ncbi:MAG: hypothetical protein JWR73_1764 [Tardiphaga sp.]|nr:hypothetical protein [Tardiphaga sp.]
MSFQRIAGAALRAVTAAKDGPSLYDVCDPVLRGSGRGDPHLAKFYKTGLGNPPLRALLRRAGLPELRDHDRFNALQGALVQARDQPTPDWAEIGRPVADLLDGLSLSHPQPKSIAFKAALPAAAAIDATLQICATHLLTSYARNGYIPAYAAFNLIGDPDLRGKDFLAALTGLNARGYKNSTLLFNLARIFIARSPAHEIINPPWTGIAEPMWQPMQVRHRSAYYDAFYIEALLSFAESGLASSVQQAQAKGAIDAMTRFCLHTSRETVPAADGGTFDVVTAIAPPPHPRFSKFFTNIKQTLGFDIYVPDCDTTACAVSAATQAGVSDPLLDQPLIDFYAGYQVKTGENAPRVTVPLNDHIDYDGGIVTWIDNLAGQRPYGNDLDPTLNLDVLEVSFRNCARWRIVETPSRLATIQRILGFQRRLVESGQFADPRAHIYYLPELYSAYVGRCYAAFRALPAATQRAIDPDDAFGLIRARVLAYVQDHLIAHEMNAFDAALALIALGHLDADAAHFAAPLACIVASRGEGGRHGPFKAYEWNKMKTPTRIIVGGPEVTSAFVLMGLALARRTLARR